MILGVVNDRAQAWNGCEASRRLCIQTATEPLAGHGRRLTEGALPQNIIIVLLFVFVFFLFC